MAKKPTSRNTKAEILAAYKELAKEKSVLETQVKQQGTTAVKMAPPAPATTNGNGNGKVQTIAKPVEKTASDRQLEQQRMQDTIALLKRLELGFGSATSDLSEKLTTEATQLAELQENIAENLQRLQDLHEIVEIDDDTLDNLVEEYERSDKQFQEEFAQRREELENALSEQKKEWMKAQERYYQNRKERNEDYEKSHQRDEAEYRYNLDLQRHLDEEQYQQQQEERYRQLEELQETKEKEWEEREKSVSDREKEFAELETKVENFKEQKEEQVEKGKQNGTNIARYQAKVKSDLKAKEIEGKKQSYDLQIQALEETIGNQELQINNLSSQLNSALTQVQDLAVKAIEGSANKDSLKAVKDIAIEQARNQQRNK